MSDADDATHQRYPPLDVNPPRVRAASVSIVRLDGGASEPVQDDVALEEPLEIRVRGRSVSVTMRTPGHDVELAAGFLLSEGMLRSRKDVYRIAHCGASDGGDVLDVTPAPQTPVDLDALTRHVFASSSCGVCGKATIENLRRRLAPIDSSVRVGPATIARLPDAMRGAQRTFDRTGGLHAAALFDAAGRLLVLREDVGRHNAVDKVLGHVLLADALPSAAILLVSGRSSFEIVQKAWAARVPIVASVSAPSSLAVATAEEAGITLIGFLRGERMNLYAHAHRVVDAHRVDDADPTMIDARPLSRCDLPGPP